MLCFVIKIVGTMIEVHASDFCVYNMCNEFISENKAYHSIIITSEDIVFEREKAIREAELEGLPSREYSEAYLETIALQRKITEILFDHDTLLFHGSVIAVDGQAYLFTAKSGTGKSTHTRFWREVFGDRAIMVNDDKPFLRITQEGVIAYGSPWNGKHGLGNNIHVPLKAICILERGEENRIQPITPQEALPMLMQQSQRPQNRKNLLKYMELVDQLSQKTEFYRMSCNMDPEAAVVAYEAMSGKRKED